MNLKETLARLFVQDMLIQKKRHLLQLLVLPSFDPVSSYKICQYSARHKHDKYYAELTCWRRDLDSEKFFNPIVRLKYPRPLPPTIERRSAEITEEFANELLNRFKKIYIPAIAENTIFGVDRTSYEVNFCDHWAGSHFHWWNDAPPEWQTLERAFHDVLRSLDEKINPA